MSIIKHTCSAIGSSQFIVAIDQNIVEVTGRRQVPQGPEFGYTLHSLCTYFDQILSVKFHKTFSHDQRLPQFIMARDYNIFKVTDVIHGQKLL